MTQGLSDRPSGTSSLFTRFFFLLFILGPQAERGRGRLRVVRNDTLPANQRGRFPPAQTNLTGYDGLEVERHRAWIKSRPNTELLAEIELPGERRESGR